MEQVGGETVGSQYDLVAKECVKPVTHIKYVFEQSGKRNEQWGGGRGWNHTGRLYCTVYRPGRYGVRGELKDGILFA